MVFRSGKSFSRSEVMQTSFAETTVEVEIENSFSPFYTGIAWHRIWTLLLSLSPGGSQRRSQGREWSQWQLMPLLAIIRLILANDFSLTLCRWFRELAELKVMCTMNNKSRCCVHAPRQAGCSPHLSLFSRVLISNWKYRTHTHTHRSQINSKERAVALSSRTDIVVPPDTFCCVTSECISRLAKHV